jgi:hypothetical protein
MLASELIEQIQSNIDEYGDRPINIAIAVGDRDYQSVTIDKVSAFEAEGQTDFDFSICQSDEKFRP